MEILGIIVPQDGVSVDPTWLDSVVRRIESGEFIPMLQNRNVLVLINAGVYDD